MFCNLGERKIDFSFLLFELNSKDSKKESMLTRTQIESLQSKFTRWANFTAKGKAFNAFKISTLPDRVEYRQFWIRNRRANQKKVDDFWDLPRPTGTCSSGPDLSKFRSLYNQKKEYFPFSDDGVKKYFSEPSQDDMKLFMVELFVSRLKILLNETEQALGKWNKLKKAKEIQQMMVEAHSFITHPSMAYKFAHKFVPTVGKKMIEFTAKEGIPEAFLVFALYFPELVTSEIEPYMNFETDIYQSTDFQELYDGSTYHDLMDKYGHHSGFFNPESFGEYCVDCGKKLPESNYEDDHESFDPSYDSDHCSPRDCNLSCQSSYCRTSPSEYSPSSPDNSPSYSEDDFDMLSEYECDSP